MHEQDPRLLSWHSARALIEEFQLMRQHCGVLRLLSRVCYDFYQVSLMQAKAVGC